MTIKRKAELEWSKLKSRSAAQRRGLGQLSKDISALVSAKHVDSITGCIAVKEELAAWQKAITEAAGETGKALETLQVKSAEELETLDERLARAFREAGHEVYGETGLLVVNGVVHVETDKRKLSVKVNGVPAAELAVEAVCADVNLQLERIRTSSTPTPEFIALLCKAYEGEVKASSKPFGSQVTTSQLICPVALLRQQPQFRVNPASGNFREYPRELFRADLYSLLKSNITQIGIKRFHFASGSDTAGAVFMLVPQYRRTAHVGRIWFEHSES